MEDAQPELPQVNIGGSATDRAVKLVYNQLEQTQGITDLKDNLREGDVAAPSSLPRNPVTQFAAETGHQYFQGSSVSVPEAMAGARQGANESAGIMKAIQQKHMGTRP
jgi:hypothetical protein